MEMRRNRSGKKAFGGADHLRRIIEEAQAMVNTTLAATPDRSGKS
jgi:hypothetical protein